jgi:FkbM family methyltransferase
MMRRPFFLRLLPDRLKLAACARFYRLDPPSAEWRGLYEGAPLRFAPSLAMDLVPGDVISDSIAFTGLWDLRLTRRVCRLAQRGGTMIDVGAHLGYFSLLWAAGNPNNRCFAFEASPRNTDLLMRNVGHNAVAPRIDIIPRAAGKGTGTVSFDLGPPDQRGWGGISPGAGADAVNVNVVRIDEAVAPPGDVSLLKIDVEGADTWALMGCERLLRARRVKEICFEQNKPRMAALGIAAGEAEAYLRSVGYSASAQSDPAAEVVEWSAWPV